VRKILKHISREALSFSVVVILAVLFSAVVQAAPGEKRGSGKPGDATPAQKQPEQTSGVPAATSNADEASDPDLPAGLAGNVDAATYLKMRAEYIGRLRGIDPDNPPNPQLRVNAIRTLEQQEQQLRDMERAARSAGGMGPFTPGSWTELGPAPIPNGQTSPSVAVSGRVAAIAVHPTNPNTVYVGTAGGGVYRSLDGGATWTPLMDSALSLAVGAVAISPSQPSTIYVGTGEANFSLDSFFGVGVYRIDNADTSPVLVGPLNKDGGANDVFTGSAISQIIVHPTDPNTIFVSTTSGASGLNGGPFFPTPARGLFRSTNAAGPAGSVTFTKLTVATANGGNRSVTDIVMDPSNPNNVVTAVFGNPVAGDGGYYFSSNAQALTPTFSQTLPLLAQTMRLAINKVASTVTVLAGSGDNGTSGVVRRSTDGGQTWSAPIPAANGYCDGQCFYDAPVAMKPDDANTFFLGGQAGSLTLRKTINSGTSFTTPNVSLHADTHSIVYAPSDLTVMYEGNDGGVWRSADGGNTWTSRNTAGFGATQFQSLALHPSDRNFMIGGTQDNGTPMMRADGSWFRADFGDGGYSLIDQNAPDATNVTMYHTYFNQTNNLLGYAHVTGVASAFDGNWTFSGCNGIPGNGITCTDSVMFYAPMARGPGSPNTIYYGSDHLYRSADGGTNHTVVSQNPLVAGVPVSTIGISPQNDNVRIVGLRNGKVFATTTGSTTLTDVTGPIPARYIARAIIDPSNQNTAYVTLDSYGLPAGQHVWKTTNLNGAPPTWTASGTGIPDVPVNSIVVDPTDSTSIYAASDIGVYHSGDSGATWSPFGTGLPRVACFDIAIQNTNRVLRVATHGRGIWETSLGALPTTTMVVSSVNPSVFGQSVTFTATVSGTGTPTGTVQFKDSGITIGSGTLSGGVATFATAALHAGAHNITAVYGGDSTFAGSTGSLPTQTVNRAATTTALGVDINPSTFGTTVTFTATVSVTAPGGGTPTGTVIFMDGATVLGSNTLAGGTPDAVAFATNALAIGPHNITAVYNGDANFTGSTGALSPMQTVTGATVGPADVEVAVSNSPNSPTGVIAIGAPLRFTITVTNHGIATTAHVKLNLSTVAGPSELDGIGGTIGVTCSPPGPGSIQCDIAALAPGASETVTIQVRPLFSDFRTFTGIASISTNTVDSGAFPHHVEVPLNVRPRPRGIRR